MSNVAKTALRGVTYYDPTKADDGYSLFCPKATVKDWSDVLLIDMQGHILNHWRIPRPPQGHARLLPNGHLIYAGHVDNIPEYMFDSDGRRLPWLGGEIVELDWDGNMVWRADTPYVSHDFYPFDACQYSAWPHNGHVIYAAYDPNYLTSPELADSWKGGNKEDKWEGKYIISDNLVEIDRKGKVVWRWLAGEHLNPDLDSFPPLSGRTHFHINAVGLCPDGNIIVSMRQQCRVHKIEYPSGKVIKRYGEGEVYFQHDCEPLPNGNILVLDNGVQRPIYEAPYTRSVEFDGETGEIVWEYKADPPSSLYSPNMAGNERLPNDNTLICDTCNGRAVEVTRGGEVVWEYVCPVMTRSVGPAQNTIFRFHRYPRDYPAFRDKDLDPERLPWENLTWGPSAWKRSFTPCVF